jgi:hypothetical protein
MFDFRFSRDSGITLLHLTGSIEGDEDLDRLTESFAFVQPNDHLILDVSAVHALDDVAAMTLHDTLMRRAVMAETVVVSQHGEVSLQLVLHDVDRACPIVRTVGEAVAILDSRWANRRQIH